MLLPLARSGVHRDSVLAGWLNAWFIPPEEVTLAGRQTQHAGVYTQAGESDLGD
jgi:hypothetical protein